MSITFPVTYYPWRKDSSIKYSSDIQNQLKKAITNLFKDHRPNFELNENTAIKINGRRITVKSGGMKQKLEIKRGTKQVVLKGNWDLNETSVDGPEFRKAVKRLQQEARVLGLMEDEACHFPLPLSTPEPAPKTLTDKIQAVTVPVADGVAILRNLLSFIRICSFISVIAYLINSCPPVLSVIAGFRIFQGVLSLFHGAKKYREARELYRLAEQNHDREGMKIWENQMNSARTVIFEGVMWIALGITFLACLHTGLIYAAMQAVMFYAGFGWDSVQSWKIANLIMNDIRKQYGLFNAAVLKNDQLTIEEKQKASLRFLRIILDVTEDEEMKIREDGAAEETIRRRIEQKRTRNRMVAARMGITLELYLDAVKGRTDAYRKIQECFEKSVAEQRVQKFLAGASLFVSALGLPLDLADWVNSLKFIEMGMNPDVLGAGTDALWVLVNLGYLAEDAPCLGQPITRFLEPRMAMAAG